MKSKVIQLWDYTATSIPEELRRWRVTEQEIDQALVRLSQIHARETEADTVQARDGVVCRGESGIPRWNRPVLLFYPGYGLCEKALEEALLGLGVGARQTVAASDGEVTLTVLRILRGREPFPICDELVKRARIDGVETVADYRRWFREKTETERRQERSTPIGQYLMREIMTKSQVIIDKEEESVWTWDWVDHIWESLTEKGDDCKARFGLDPSLTDDEAKQQLFEEYRDGFRSALLFRALIRQSGQDADQVLRQGMEEYLEQAHQTEEELIRSSGLSAVEYAILMHAAKEIIFGYSKQHIDEILED